MYRKLDGQTKIIQELYNKNPELYCIAFKQKKNSYWAYCYRPKDLTYRNDFDYKLMDISHSNILKAYTTNNNIKIYYRWFDEDWMVLKTDFVETYDFRASYKI